MRSRSVPVKNIRPPRSSFVIASSEVNVEPSFRSAGSLSRCPMIRLSPVLGGAGEPFLVTLPQLLRNDELAEDASDRLLASPAERVLGGGVPLADDLLRRP